MDGEPWHRIGSRPCARPEHVGLHGGDIWVDDRLDGSKVLVSRCASRSAIFPTTRSGHGARPQATSSSCRRRPRHDAGRRGVFAADRRRGRSSGRGPPRRPSLGPRHHDNRRPRSAQRTDRALSPGRCRRSQCRRAGDRDRCDRRVRTTYRAALRRELRRTEQEEDGLVECAPRVRAHRGVGQRFRVAIIDMVALDEKGEPITVEAQFSPMRLPSSSSPPPAT